MTEPRTATDEERAILTRRRLQDQIIADVSEQFDQVRKRLDDYTPEDPTPQPRGHR